MKVYTERSRSGFTLAEILISMGISVIVGGLLMTIIVNSAGLFKTESSKLTQGLNANDALYNVRALIKQSSSVVQSFTYSAVTYTSGAEQLVTKIPSIDSSNKIISETFDYIVFFKDSNQLRLKIFPDAQSARKSQDQIFSTNVDSLNFQYFNSTTPPVEVVPTSATKVKINLSLKQSIGTKIEVSNVSSEASLRND